MAKKSAKASMKCGEVRPSNRAGKKVMKLYCEGGKRKLVKSFRARHKCDTAKPGTARHLACTELWAGKGGSTKSSPKSRRGKY
jgi:hypothetical protein